jgi:hypothetical protein
MRLAKFCFCTVHSFCDYQSAVSLSPRVFYSQRKYSCRMLSWLRKCALKLTAWGRVLLEKLIVSYIVKKLSTFYGTRWFITCSQQPAIGSSLEQDESSPRLHPLSVKSILILFSHQPSKSCKLSLSFRFPYQKLVCIFFPYVLRASPYHLPWFDHANIWWAVKLLKLLLM